MPGPGGTGAFDFEWAGLRELNTYLKRLGVPDSAVKQAMADAGLILQREALRLAPKDTGRMAGTLKVSKAKGELRVSVGNNTTVKYAHPYHVPELSGGKVRVAVAHVKPYTRRVGRGKPKAQVAGHTRRRALVDWPFMYEAARRKQQAVLTAYVTAIGKLIEEAKRGLPV